MSLNDRYKHFIREDEDNGNSNKYYVGNHLIVDAYEISDTIDVKFMIEHLKKGCINAGATVLYDYVHDFGEGCGTTGAIILAESHVTWHHYPETNMIMFDVFMCGKCDPSMLIEYIRFATDAKEMRITNLKRGRI